MKHKTLKYLLGMLLLRCCVDAQAQFRIYTKKSRLSDFPAKTTMVVLSGNELLDIAIKNEIKSRWRVSPFEFCFKEDLESIKVSPLYYILYLTEENNSLIYLNLEKCGDKKGFSSMNSRMDILKLPLSPKDFSTGREISYLSAMIDIMQHYVESSILHDQVVYMNLDQFSGPLSKGRKKTLYIAREDLSDGIAGKDSLSSSGHGLVYTDSFTVDSLFNAGSADALIGFCISSNEPSPKSESIQVIVSADRHELLYYKKNKYKKIGQRGFTQKSLKAIQAEHKYKNDTKH